MAGSLELQHPPIRTSARELDDERLEEALTELAVRRGREAGTVLARLDE